MAEAKRVKPTEEDNKAFAKQALELMPWLKEERTYNQLLSLEEGMTKDDKMWVEELSSNLWNQKKQGMKFHAHPLHEELEYFRFCQEIMGVIHHKLGIMTLEEFNTWQKAADEDEKKE